LKRGFSRLLAALTISLLVMVLVAGCGGQKKESAPSEGKKAEGKEPIKFGVIVPLSGSQAILGEEMERGAKIAVKQVNDAGGIMGRPVELVIRDTKANPDTGVAVARELLSQGINMYFGVASSAVALAVSPLMEKEKGVIITTAAHSDRLTHQNFNKHYFRITDNPYMRERAMAKLMAERYPNTTKWGCIIPDHEYGRSTWDNFEAGLKKYYPEIAKKELEIVSVQRAPYGATDYKNFITAVLNSKAKGVFTSEYGGDAVTMFRQAVPYAFFDKIDVMVDSANEFLVPKAMGNMTPPHWIGTHWYYEAYKDSPMAKKVYDEYVKEYKDKYPTGWVGEAHSALMAYKAAIEKAKATDTDAVIKALEGLTFDSVSGKRTIRAEDHQTIKDVNIIHVVPVKEEPGWKVDEFKVYKGDDLIEPPSPGKPLKLE